MSFILQASNPAVRRPTHADGGDLSSAVTRVFAASTEDAVLTWNGVAVLLSYNGNLGEILPEVLDMLEACTAASSGDQLVRFGSTSFRAHWHLRWGAGQLALDGRWSSVRGGYEALLNERPTMALPLDEFLAEWKAVLVCIMRAIDAGGVKLEAGDDRLDRLRVLVTGLPAGGRRYRNA